MFPSLVILFAVSTLGTESLWEKLPDGGVQVTVRLDPSNLGQIQPGDELEIEIPPGSQDLRRIRFVGGESKLTKTDATSRFQSIVAKPESPPLTTVGKASEKTPDRVTTKGADNQKLADNPKAADNQKLAEKKAADKIAPVASEIVGPRFPEGNLPTTGNPPSTPPVAKDSVVKDPAAKDPAALADATPADPWRSVMDKKDSRPDVAKTHVVGYSPTDPANGQPTVAKENVSWWLYALGGGLVASLAANVFLGWVHMGQRSRYRDLARKLFAGPPADPA